MRNGRLLPNARSRDLIARAPYGIKVSPLLFEDYYLNISFPPSDWPKEQYSAYMKPCLAMKKLTPVRAAMNHHYNWHMMDTVCHGVAHNFIGIYGAPAMAVLLFVAACVGNNIHATERIHTRVSSIAAAVIDEYPGGIGRMYVPPSRIAVNVSRNHPDYVYHKDS